MKGLQTGLNSTSRHEHGDHALIAIPREPPCKRIKIAFQIARKILRP